MSATPIPPILVVDIETTSEDRELAGIVEIGALWIDPSLAGSGSIGFEIKCRPRPHCEIQEAALQFNGCDWHESRHMPSETAALIQFAAWLGKRPHILMAGCNVGFDWHILKNGWRDARNETTQTPLATEWPFGFRTIDVHSAAVIDAIQGGFGDTIPALGLKSRFICEAFEVPEEPKPHRAMAGAAWECAVLRKILGLDPA